MPDDPYSLADLARLADVTPRTVRYYIAQGLLPAPEAAGPATRYGEGHLARLRLIRRLQRDHLPLAEIRARLERMGDDEIVAGLAATDAQEPPMPTSTAETLAYVRDLMTRSGVSPRFYDQPTQPPPSAPAPMSMPLLKRTHAAREVPDEFPMRDTPSLAWPGARTRAHVAARAPARVARAPRVASADRGSEHLGAPVHHPRHRDPRTPAAGPALQQARRAAGPDRP